jgi:hypothetical protein
MSRSYDGANDRLQVAAAVFDATAIDATPVAIATWIKRARTSAAAEEFLACGGVSGATSHYCAIAINTSNQVLCRTRTTSNAEAIDTVNTITDTTTWHLVFAVWKGIADRRIYVDGNAGVANTTSRDPVTATDFFCLGATPESGIGSEYQGLQGYTAVWTGLSKTDGQWDAMRDAIWNSGAGADLSTIESANQVAYWPLTSNADPEVNSKNPGTFDLTVTTATFSTDNPFTLGGGGATVPKFMNSYAARRRAS